MKGASEGVAQSVSTFGVAYLAVSAAGHLVWEFLQLPLYTIWQQGTAAEMVYAVLHCTIGDVLIAAGSLAVAWAIGSVFRNSESRFSIIAILAIAIGVGYTAFSEWHNVYVRGSWAYSAIMPTLSFGKLSIGLSPLVQWIVVPASAMASVHSRMRQSNAR